MVHPEHPLPITELTPVSVSVLKRHVPHRRPWLTIISDSSADRPGSGCNREEFSLDPTRPIGVTRQGRVKSSSSVAGNRSSPDPIECNAGVSYYKTDPAGAVELPTCEMILCTEKSNFDLLLPINFILGVRSRCQGKVG